MYQLVVGFLLNVLVLSLIGLGPTLLLLKHGQRTVLAGVIAPVVGVVLTTIVGSWLIMCGLPVSRWAWWWVILASASSLLFAVPRLMRDWTEVDEMQRRTGLAAVAMLGMTTALLLAPQVVGGLRYSQLRGNGADTLNYVAGAGFVDHEPRASLKLDEQELVDRHQSNLRARSLVSNDRWAAFMLLAFASRVAGVPIYQFDYCFTLIFLLLASGVAYLIAVRLCGRLFLAGLVAVAVATGFWAQYVLDNRAVSHLTSIPVLLLIVLLLARLEGRESSDKNGTELILLGLVGAALIIQYPEISPMLGAGVFLYFFFRLISKQVVLKKLAGYLISGAIMIFAVVPIIGLLVTVLVERAKAAAMTQVPSLWVKAGLSWLYTEPVLGFWGLSPFADTAFPSQAISGVLHRLFEVEGVALTVVLVSLCVWHLVQGRKKLPIETSLVVCMTMACLIQAGFLLARHQLWPAGKAFSYGYPFVLLAMAGFSFSSWMCGGSRVVRILIRVMRFCVLLWLVVQCGLGVFRLRLADTGKEFENYFWHHGEYRRHDLDFSGVSTVLGREDQPHVWSYISNVTVSEYAGFALGWETRMVSLLPTIDSIAPNSVRQRIVGNGEYLLTDQRKIDAVKHAPELVVAQTGDLLLLRMKQGEVYHPVVVDCHLAGNDTMGAGSAASFRLGFDPVVITLVAPVAGYALFQGDFKIGPPAEGRDYAPLKIRSSATDQTELIVVTNRTTALKVPVERGVNEITFCIMNHSGRDESQPAQVLSIAGLQIVMDSSTQPVMEAGKENQRKAYEYTALSQLIWRPSAEASPGQQSSAFIEAGAKSRLEVKSQKNDDYCLIAPLKLSPGLYRFSAVISGKVDGLPTGAAHLSIHGKSKLISIPAGTYSSQPFESYYDAPSGALEAQIAFGLGGWSLGRGEVVLEKLTIEKIW